MKKTNQLIESIKTRAYTPGSSGSFSDAVFLDLLNREIQDYVVPRIKYLRQEFGLVTNTEALQGGQERVKIPRRSLAGSIRELVFVDPVRGPTRMDMIARDDAQFFRDRLPVGYFPQKYYLDGNDIVLVPPAPLESQIKITYFQRPSELVLQSLERTVLNINPATNTLQLNSYAEFLSTGDAVDVVSRDWPTDLNMRDATVLEIDLVNNTVRLNSSVADVKVGDKLYQSGKTCLPMIPEEMESLLITRVCLRIAEMQNDDNAVAITRAAILEMESGFKLLVSDRVSNDAPKMVRRNGLL